jgi:hypothetical protein
MRGKADIQYLTNGLRKNPAALDGVKFERRREIKNVPLSRVFHHHGRMARTQPFGSRQSRTGAEI